ncbi:MAG: hypothetical protein U0670_05085 [Anaerolineae bacterium]
MKELLLNIERVRRINETHQHIHLSSDAMLLNLKAGQSLLARVGEQPDGYLREQWYPVSISRTEVVVERPVSTPYMPGTTVQVLAMVGQPFRYRRTLRGILLIAHNTPPTALLMSIPALIANHVNVTLVLLGTAAQYRTEHLPPEVEVIIGDTDFNWANRVTTVGWADQVFVVVDPADEMTHFRRVWAVFHEVRADIPKSYLFAVFQPLLPCGVGVSACMVSTKNGQSLTCVSGPSFDMTELHLS